MVAAGKGAQDASTNRHDKAGTDSLDTRYLPTCIYFLMLLDGNQDSTAAHKTATAVTFGLLLMGLLMHACLVLPHLIPATLSTMLEPRHWPCNTPNRCVSLLSFASF